MYTKAQISDRLEGDKVIIIHDSELVDKIYLTESILLEVPLNRVLSGEQIEFLSILPRVANNVSGKHEARMAKAAKELLPGIKVKNSTLSLYTVNLKENDVIATLSPNSVKSQAIKTRKGKLVLGEVTEFRLLSSSESSAENSFKTMKSFKPKTYKTKNPIKKSAKRKDESSTETD